MDYKNISKLLGIDLEEEKKKFEWKIKVQIEKELEERVISVLERKIQTIIQGGGFPNINDFSIEVSNGTVPQIQIFILVKSEMSFEEGIEIFYQKRYRISCYPTCENLKDFLTDLPNKLKKCV